MKGYSPEVEELLIFVSCSVQYAKESIAQYSDRELRNLLEWVQSDGRLRTNDQIADEMFAALPFSRRGSKIEEALNRTIRFWETTNRKKG
jgi:hypothetical protein